MPAYPVQPGHKIDGSLLPYGTNTAITSTPPSGDTYRHGETINFSIVFSAPLEVEGSPQLNLRVGDVGMGQRGARLEGGSGTTALLFGYTVAPHDLDIDGVTILGTAMETGGIINAVTILETSRRTLGIPGLGGDGTIKVKGTNTVVTSIFSGLLDQSGHKMDGRPYPQSISITSSPAAESDTYGPDEVIQVSVQFDQNVTAGADAAVILQIGSDSNNSRATYASGNGTPTLVFEYTVESGDTDGDGISGYLPHGHDIKATGTDALYQPGAGEDRNAMTLGVDANHKVEGSLTGDDATAPTISSVAITSDPGDDDTYGLGDAIQVTVTFSEDVTVTGTPQLELDLGGTAKTADYSSTNGTAVVFSYTVAQDDTDNDGIAISADKLTLNDGTIQDEAENDATLTHTAVAADSGHRVDGSDTTAPTISSLSFTSDPGSDGTYGTGDTVQVTVTFSENVTVTVTGTPQMELSMSNSSNRQASYSSSNSSGADVVFEYTVVVGDRASDGLEIRANKLTLNDGTIRDASGNDATLTHSNYFVPSNHFVNGIGGV